MRVEVLMCDGPLNGLYHDLRTVYCPDGHDWKLILLGGDQCPCGKDLYFRAGGAVYCYQQWSPEIEPTEYVGVFVHTIEGPA